MALICLQGTRDAVRGSVFWVRSQIIYIQVKGLTLKNLKN